jgi:hypothetical protein
MTIKPADACNTSDVPHTMLLMQVYACFAQLDLGVLSSCLDPADAALLTFIRQYCKFRQGEVWQGIAADFEAAGLSPTQEDK